MFYLAKLETSHFSFHAIDKTEELARGAMRRAWRAHCKAYGQRDNWAEFADDVNVCAIEIGAGYRDGERIVKAKRA